MRKRYHEKNYDLVKRQNSYDPNKNKTTYDPQKRKNAYDQLKHKSVYDPKKRKNSYELRKDEINAKRRRDYEKNKIRYSEQTELLQNENMKKFQESMKHQIIQCNICFEAWPVNSNIKSHEYTCTRCKRDKGLPKKV